MQVSLPMYGVGPQAAEAFWRVLRGKLQQLGLTDLPPMLSWPQDLAQHWQEPDLLLSQTCGYPIINYLPHVQLVGTYHYHVEGCVGPNYSSWLVVRDSEPGNQLADFRGRVAAYNNPDSQSGHYSLIELVAPLAEQGKFFSQAVASGAHYQSIKWLQSGQADIAAIDCISWQLLKNADPQALNGLKIIGRTAVVPGLPLITAPNTSAETLAILRAGALAMVEEQVSKDLLIGDFTLEPRSTYQVLSQLEQDAAGLGVTAL